MVETLTFPDPSTALTPHELEFLAADMTISIVPNFSLQSLQLIQGTFGPFRAQVPVRVPLWVALQLRRSRRCRIQPPDWMDVTFLESALELERSETNFFKEMPAHFIEVAMLLLKTAADDIESPEKLSSILSSLEGVRSSKLRDSFYNLGVEFTSASVNNLSHMEINNMRPYISKGLDAFYMLEHATDDNNLKDTFDNEPFTQEESVLEESQDLDTPLRPFRS